MKSKNSVAPEYPAEEPYSLLKLRQLVAAMTMPEKNAFKRHIRNYRDNNHEASYIQMFDCINECLAIDNRRAKKAAKTAVPAEQADNFYQKFKWRNDRRGIVKPSDLGGKSNYLFDKIIESQRNQNIEGSKRRELYAMMLDVQFLFAKGMAQECFRALQAVKQLASELEALPQMLELMQIERRLYGMIRNDNLSNDLRAMYELEQKCLMQMQLVTAFNDLRMEITLLHMKQGVLEKEEGVRSKINFFLDKVGGNPSLDTFDLYYYYHAVNAGLVRLDMQSRSRFLRFLQHEGFKTALKHYKAIVDLYQKYPERKKEDFQRYLNDLGSYLSNAYASDDKEVQLKDYESDLAQISTTDPNFLNLVVYITLIDCIKGRRFKDAIIFLDEKRVWELLGRFGKMIPQSRLQTVQQSAGTVFFVRGEFEKADRWFLNNLNIETKVFNKEVVTASALYHLLCRFELGRTDTVTFKKVLLDDLTELLDLPDDPDSFEVELLKALNDILKAGNDPHQLKPVCSKYLPVLQEKLAGKVDPGHFHLFIAWIESKSTGKPLRITVDKYL